jgi:hypothetical protein
LSAFFPGAAVKAREASKSALAGDIVISRLDKASPRDDLASLNLSNVGEVLGSRLYVVYKELLYSLSSEVPGSYPPEVNELKSCINCGSIGRISGLVLDIKDPSSSLI